MEIFTQKQFPPVGIYSKYNRKYSIIPKEFDSSSNESIWNEESEKGDFYLVKPGEMIKIVFSSEIRSLRNFGLIDYPIDEKSSIVINHSLFFIKITSNT